MNRLRLIFALAFLLGAAMLNSEAHPGHSERIGQKPWYGYLPKSVLTQTIRLLP